MIVHRISGNTVDILFLKNGDEYAVCTTEEQPFWAPWNIILLAAAAHWNMAEGPLNEMLEFILDYFPEESTTMALLANL